MKIWIVGRNYPSDENNLQGSFELEQAKMLSKHGHEVSYLSCPFHTYKKSKKWGYNTWKEDGISVYTYAQIFFPERLKIHWDSFKSYVWKKLLSTVEAESGLPDIIHIHYPAYIGVADVFLSYKRRGTKIICTEHWTHVLNHTLDNYEYDQLKNYVEHADHFLCVSHTLKDAVIEITNTTNEISVVPNIVDINIFKPTENKKDGYRFVAVGVLNPHKQFDKIITAFTKEFKGRNCISLTIVGDGNTYENLKKLIKKQHMEDHIFLTGRLNRTETAEQIAISDCLICYSSMETFGVPVIEGWACGIPVIASTATAVIDTWNENLGLLADSDDICDLEKKMFRMYHHKNDYDSAYISDYAKNNYSEEVVYNILLNYYIY